jgi:hypothetical protein
VAEAYFSYFPTLRENVERDIPNTLATIRAFWSRFPISLFPRFRIDRVGQAPLTEIDGRAAATV